MSVTLSETQDLISGVVDSFSRAKNDYNASRRGRFRRKRRGVSSVPHSADYHYWSESDFLYAMEVARDLDRNDIVVGQGIDRVCDNVVRDGFMYDPNTGSKQLDALLKKKWTAYANTASECDSAGEHAFPALERFAFRSSLVDGDIFVALKHDGKIDLIEAHRPRTPRNPSKKQKNGPVKTDDGTTIVHGVEIGKGRQRINLWISRENLDPSKATTANTKCDPIPFFDSKSGDRITLQVYRPKRVSQTRGFTALAPIVDPCGMHDDIQFALLVQRQIVSCFGFIRKQLPPEAGLPPDTNSPAALGATTTEQRSDGTTRTVEGIAPGMEVPVGPNEDLQAFSPQVPNPEFFPHAMMVLTFIAINLGLPVQVLLLDPKETNFSGWRGAIDQARLGFKRLQNNLIQRFHTPIIRWKIKQWLADDDEVARLAAEEGVDVFAHTWHPPSWDYIEPSKDMIADMTEVRNSLTSQRRRCAKRGHGDWGNLVGEIVADNLELAVQAFEAAKEANVVHPGLDIGWRELAYTPTPDGVTVQLPLGEEMEQPNSGQSKKEGVKIGQDE